LKDAVLLVMANKQDLPNAMSTQELRNSCAAARERGSWGWVSGAGAKAGPQQPGEISEEMARAGRTVPHRSAPFRTVPHRSARRIMNYDMTRYHKVSQYMREDKILYYINLYHILSYTISDAIF